jgi:hypothetical protein
VSLLLCRKRFGKARARLAQLQEQLDSIIQDMPPPHPGLFTFLVEICMVFVVCTALPVAIFALSVRSQERGMIPWMLHQVARKTLTQQK